MIYPRFAILVRTDELDELRIFQEASETVCMPTRTEVDDTFTLLHSEDEFVIVDGNEDFWPALTLWPKGGEPQACIANNVRAAADPPKTAADVAHFVATPRSRQELEHAKQVGCCVDPRPTLVADPDASSYAVIQQGLDTHLVLLRGVADEDGFVSTREYRPSEPGMYRVKVLCMPPYGMICDAEYDGVNWRSSWSENLPTDAVCAWQPRLVDEPETCEEKAETPAALREKLDRIAAEKRLKQVHSGLLGMLFAATGDINGGYEEQLKRAQDWTNDQLRLNPRILVNVPNGGSTN